MNNKLRHRVTLALRSPHRKLVLWRALRELKRDPQACIDQDNDVIADLIYGWGNEGWSASANYLSGCIREALRCDGPILECGSGLTTLAVGLVAARNGNTLCAIEHIEAWRQRVQGRIGGSVAPYVSLRLAPLKDYGEFSWYEASPELLRSKFTLVLCDGPPGTTPGGRYGLMPILGDALAPGCVVLLDDASRGSEQAIARRWQQEYGMTCETVGANDPYFRMTMQGLRKRSDDGASGNAV